MDERKYMGVEAEPETLKEKKERTLREAAYRFRGEGSLSEAQLTDPDYRLKQLMKGNGGYPAICSKCHHCR